MQDHQVYLGGVPRENVRNVEIKRKRLILESVGIHAVFASPGSRLHDLIFRGEG